VNNVITYCDNGFNVDMRGSTRMTKYDLVDGLLAVGYRAEPWKSRYPDCAAIPDNWAAISAPDALWLYPQNSVYSRNIGFMNTNVYKEIGTPFMYFKERKDNIDNQDPLFVDEAHLDMTLRPDSPALAIPGFQPIPFDRIGIRP
jgi:hypothetical protein